MIDVVIPALNEQKTIGSIVRVFKNSDHIGQVFVMVDDQTTDDTANAALHWGAVTFRKTELHGKGQLLRFGLTQITTEQVIFSDADYTGLNGHHVQMLTSTPYDRMRILSAPYPTRAEWARSGIPGVPFNPHAWVVMSGLRCLPAAMLFDSARGDSIPLHGYLTEVQINKRAKELTIPIDTLVAPSLHAPLRFTKQRLTDMEEHGKWGLENGVFL